MSHTPRKWRSYAEVVEHMRSFSCFEFVLRDMADTVDEDLRAQKKEELALDYDGEPDGLKHYEREQRLWRKTYGCPPYDREYWENLCLRILVRNQVTVSTAEQPDFMERVNHVYYNVSNRLANALGGRLYLSMNGSGAGWEDDAPEGMGIETMLGLEMDPYLDSQGRLRNGWNQTLTGSWVIHRPGPDDAYRMCPGFNIFQSQAQLGFPFEWGKALWVPRRYSLNKTYSTKWILLLSEKYLSEHEGLDLNSNWERRTSSFWERRLQVVDIMPIAHKRTSFGSYAKENPRVSQCTDGTKALKTWQDDLWIAQLTSSWADPNEHSIYVHRP